METLASDFLVIGGGTAGCVLAARLSEDPRNTVVLVEAGRDLTAESMDPHVASRYPGRPYLDAGNIWPDLTATLGASGRARRYEQARILGGGSVVNAMVANRGAPRDYDEWGEAGAEGWSWDACLPYFRKLEHDFDFGGPYHGTDGPIPIRRTPDRAMSPFVRTVIRTMQEAGHPLKADQNGAWEDGIFKSAVAVGGDGRRAPVSVAYLTPEVRRRPNLQVLTHHLCERIVFEGRRAAGARVAPAGGGAAATLSARNVIVSTGAIHSAALLMRSGIGPADGLGRHGIAVLQDRAGVGCNLMEHPSTAVSVYLPRAARLRDLREHHDQAILRFSSGAEGTPAGDMHMAIIARSGWHAVGRRIGTLFIWVNKSFSRGTVALASDDARVEPRVDFRLLSDPRDMERLKAGLHLGARLLGARSMDAVRRGPVFAASYSPRVAALAGGGLLNAARRGLFSALLDGSGPLRPLLIHGLVTPGLRLQHLLEDDRALTDFVGATAGGVWHASGTCRMGAPSDPLAVTDGGGRVIGVDGLTVCDASLMPTLPCANTNTPTIMIAERISDRLRAGL